MILPEISANSPEAELGAYAAETGVDIAWMKAQLRSGRPFALSFAALAVLLRGQPWGVLVLDSRRPGTIDQEKLKRFDPYASLLTPLLERI